MDISALKQMTPKKVALFVALLLVAFIVGVIAWGIIGYSQSSLGLSGSISQGTAAPSMFANPMRMESDSSAKMAYDSTREMEMNAGVAMPAPIPGSGAPAATSLIIKNANLTLVVEDVDKSAKAIDQIRAQYGGQVGNASISDYYSSRQGDITLWIPSAQFDTALESIKKIALRVTSEQITSTDVSAQFVDLGARLKNLHATELQYMEIMKRSGTINEILQVTSVLSQTRQQIEQLQGQMNHLSRQVALSSVHITLTQEIASVVSKNEWRPLAVFKNSARETLRDLTNFVDSVIVLLVSLPLFLLKLAFWGGLIYGIWRAARVLYRHLKGLSLPEGGGSV